jgi:acetoin utilization protein AcuC
MCTGADRKTLFFRYNLLFILNKIGIVYSEEIADYDFGYGHPFRGTRFLEYMQLLIKKKILEKPNVVLINNEPALNEDLLLAHSKEYIEEVEAQANLRLYISPDTPVTPRIVKAARYIVGGGLKAAELVKKGYTLVDSVGGGLHHAGRDYGGGFCVFNDVAICTMALLRKFQYERVLILDTDVHAGNGTMDIFSRDPRVLFIDLHQDPSTIYPGRGFLTEIGENGGKGFTVNVPLPPFAGDQEVDLALTRVFKPLVKQFEPQVIVRNGGSDPHFADRLGSLNMTYKGFHNIGATVREASVDVKAPIINMSCSGYNPNTVAEGLYSILAGLMDIELDVEEVGNLNNVEPQIEVVEKTIDKLAIIHQDYWTM